MDAGNRLHAPAVAVREAQAVDRLRAADVGKAVPADRDQVIRRQLARHARAPHALVTDMAVDDLVDLRELLEASLDARLHAGDELELRLAEIGGDMRMRERRAERLRMQRARERAVGLDAQALLLDAAAHALQHVRVEAHGKGTKSSRAESRARGLFRLAAPAPPHG